MSRTRSKPSEAVAPLGKTTPRLSTPPLVTGPPGPCGCGCALTPETSRGFEFDIFCRDVLGESLLPWQRHLSIHLLELKPDETYRFRTALILVARQQGKTVFVRNLALWRLYVDGAKLVLGVAQSLEIAREAWSAGADVAQTNPWLSGEVDTIRRTNGDQELRLTDTRRWRIAAANRSAGRGLSVDLLILDELREQRNWDAWGALSKTITARRLGMVVGISNAGDDQSVVLNHLRDSALSGEDDSHGLFEWSAPDGADLNDWDAIAQANPALGYTVNEQAIKGALATDPPAVFRTEVLCQHVTSLDGAIDMMAWETLTDEQSAISKADGRIVFCLDVSPDLQHVTLAAAQCLSDDRTRVALAGAWESTSAALEALPELLKKVRPAKLVWFPNGPSASLAADLSKLRRSEEIKASEVPAVCQGFAEVVTSRRLIHNGDPLLTAHAAGAHKAHTGDGWRFVRRGVGHVDALYAAAGAVHVARSLPKGMTRILVSKEN